MQSSKTVHMSGCRAQGPPPLFLSRSTKDRSALLLAALLQPGKARRCVAAAGGGRVQTTERFPPEEKTTTEDGLPAVEGFPAT